MGPGCEKKLLEDVQSYWETRVHDWGIAKSPAGSPEFFAELEGYRFRKLRYLDDLLRWLVEPYDEPKILDVGCGVGTELARMAHWSSGACLHGIDLTENALGLARDNLLARQLPSELSTMNGEQLQYEDGSFDAVFCHSTLQFTPQPERMVEEIHRVLKPGGRAVLMAVNRHSWLNLVRLLTGMGVDFEDAPLYHQHSLSEFSDMVDRFPGAQVYADRFPVHSEALGGLKGLVFNRLFVPLFSLLPRALVRPLGHHLIARCEKK